MTDGDPRVVTADELNSVMEFDHIIEVLEDGSVIDRPDVYGPELVDVFRETSVGGFWVNGVQQRWTLLNGYSGQDRYAGPIMHDSEYIGGQMARDILTDPGVYVAVASYYSPGDDDDEDDGTWEGWAVAILDE